MSDWRSVLKADPTDWLLERDNPSVQYLTLTDILERSEDDPQVKRAKMQIMETGVVPKVLAKQRNESYWEPLRTSTSGLNTREPCGNS